MKINENISIGDNPSDKEYQSLLNYRIDSVDKWALVGYRIDFVIRYILLAALIYFFAINLFMFIILFYSKKKQICLIDWEKLHFALLFKWDLESRLFLFLSLVIGLVKITHIQIMLKWYLKDLKSK